MAGSARIHQTHHPVTGIDAGFQRAWTAGSVEGDWDDDRKREN
jgi:hypothetical protein